VQELRKSYAVLGINAIRLYSIVYRGFDFCEADFESAASANFAIRAWVGGYTHGNGVAHGR
jgi:hypothetical protein